ncbi:RrF2 family transcriptional regulator [Hoeflea poritis]|uniref:Rrf2 family transcriptional regulator n=1 Tax=Hoeflea poritis TaxID=2993659 RepID=A0ABT4VHG1_9HYPH|nr:Rrf2 family transcriptional regulator [Hoeflea poritis]MDA4844143.1 Rrf2 family transcriptional regulator [Hoeflea poritis]
MKMSDGVEWAIHCVMLLGALPPSATLSGKALAEFHGIPESYLLKHLKMLVTNGILESVPGPRGGYRLARQTKDITLLDIVQAVDGKRPAFRCTEIRRRGPCALGDGAYPRCCGVNRAMMRAEQAYRDALAEATMKDITDEFMANADPRIVPLGENWLEENTRTPKS